jgi:hypothetical protein
LGLLAGVLGLLPGIYSSVASRVCTLAMQSRGIGLPSAIEIAGDPNKEDGQAASSPTNI